MPSARREARESDTVTASKGASAATWEGDLETDYEHIIVDRVGTDGRVARITLNRPERMNAIASQTTSELHSALRTLEADHEARVIILRGAGRAFSTGHDIGGAALMQSPFDPDSTFKTRDDQDLNAVET